MSVTLLPHKLTNQVLANTVARAGIRMPQYSSSSSELLLCGIPVDHLKVSKGKVEAVSGIPMGIGAFHLG